MLIFYKKDTKTNAVAPLVLIDALCTDDIFTQSEIASLVKSGVPKNVTLTLLSQKIYSTEYEFTYARNGVNPDNTVSGTEATKISFSAMVKSPSADFVSAFSPAWFLSSNALDDMENTEKLFANPETSLVYVSLVVRDVNGKFLQYNCVAYKGEMLPDPFGTTATLLITGGGFDDVVLRDKVAFNLSAKLPLKKQVVDFLATLNVKAVFKIADDGKKPVNAVFFPPQTVNQILNVICLQNKLVHSGVDDVLKTVNVYSQGPKGAPTKQPIIRVSFIGAGGAAIANNFAVSEFAKATFSTQYFATQLFDSLLFINDTNSAAFAGAVPSDTVQGFKAYIYFVLSFALTWSRETREMKVTGINNWLLGQMRIDAVLSQNIYR